MRRALPLLLGLSLLALASLALALKAGSFDLSWEDLWRALTGAESGLMQSVVLELRLPRALGAFAVGGLLALAGALMQVLLRNPLADPYVLGVSGGAAVGALGAVLLGLTALPQTAFAFAGALVSTALVFSLARGPGAWTSGRLLLTGVVIATGWGALISFILTAAPDAALRGMLFWLMGDLGQLQSALPALWALAVGLLFALPLARDLNALGRGALQAAALGVETQRLRLQLYILGSLLTAVAVTEAGSIGFIGLVVPHLLRLLGCRDHRLLLPAAALLGGALLVAADTLARTLVAPQQLPVGILTALLGVPLFLYLLSRRS